MFLLKKYIQFINYFSTKTGELVSWLSLLLVGVVCYDVGMRYVANRSSVAVQELEWHIFALIFLLAAPYTLRNNNHVRVDVIYAKMTEKTKAWVNLLGCALFLIPFCILVVYTSKDFVTSSFLWKEGSPDPGGLEMRWLLKSVIPLSFFLLMLQAFSMLFSSLLTITGHSSEEKANV